MSSPTRYDLEAAKALFAEAQQLAALSPQLNCTLADACDTVSVNMLPKAREAFQAPVELVIGIATLDGNADYVFSAKDLQEWSNGSKLRPLKFPGHAWLTVGGDILDFTLWSTYNKHRSSDDRFFAPSFLTKEIALQKGIQYTKISKGDNVLMPFFMGMSY